ncbi:MAG: bifunctional cytidylyltransferase/SDR family oxidoreductase [Bacteroidales bacterium]|nr:bifunctional cytidylyltransferase/SDR family oxidoreductase [Bacteroidales bacterium]
MNVAIILAGGIGSRTGYDTPKQFFKVAGKTVIEHSIDAFESNSSIDEIAIVINEGYVANIEEIILHNSWKKVKKVLKGGSERYMSSCAAINAYSDKPNCNLIFHDAVRPLVNARIINDVITALKSHNAVDVAVPATDTIIKVSEDGKTINEIPNRKYLKRGQTPQAFKLETIKKAYEIALKDPNFTSSDDCGTVVKYLPNEEIFVVEGEESNIKLTYKEDIFLLDKLFQLHTTTLHDEVKFDALKGKTIVVFGGNSGIGLEIMKIAEQYGAKSFSFSRGTTNTNIANKDDVAKALDEVYKQTKSIDYVVNSAAILSKEPLATMDYSFIDTIISTNYNGMINVAIESYKYLKESHGQLLMFTSSSYTRGRAFYSIYSSTKAAVVNFMQAISQEWEPDNIRVNVINPERTNTPMRTRNFGIEPENTLLKADEVAQMSVKTLLTDITGQVIDVKIRKK